MKRNRALYAVTVMAVLALGGQAFAKGGTPGGGQRLQKRDGSCLNTGAPQTQQQMKGGGNTGATTPGRGKGRRLGAGDGTGTAPRPQDGTGYGAPATPPAGK